MQVGTFMRVNIRLICADEDRNTEQKNIKT